MTHKKKKTPGIPTITTKPNNTLSKKKKKLDNSNVKDNPTEKKPNKFYRKKWNSKET